MKLPDPLRHVSDFKCRPENMPVYHFQPLPIMNYMISDKLMLTIYSKI